MGSSKKWKFDLPDWRESNLVNLQIIFEEAKKALEYTIKVKDSIADRAFTILSYLIPIISIVIGFLWNNHYSPESSITKEGVIFLLISIIPLLVILVFLIWIVFPKSFMPLGREPKIMKASQYLYSKNINEGNLQKSLLLDMVENLQQRIDYNNRDNNKRIHMLKRILWFIAAYFYLVVIYIVYLTSIGGLFVSG